MFKINRKELWKSLGNINQNDWIKAGRRLGLDVSISGGKGSHVVIRDPARSNPDEIEGLIATVQKGLYKQHNQTIFKHFIENGICEDDLWRALGKLK